MPPRAVTTGAKWNYESVLNLGPIGQYVTNHNFRYEGKEGDRDRIDVKDGGDATEVGLLAKYAHAPLILQIGGQATVGRGRIRCVFTAIHGGTD